MALGEPKYIRFLFNPEKRGLVVQACARKEAECFRVPKYNPENWEFKISSVPKMKVRVNYILDEFSSLPTIKDFPTMITAARSRNIRFNLIIQSKHQLLERYKEETETIQSNCNNWIFFTSREVKLLEELSILCGKHSNGEKYVIPPDSLQHLNKERGEALILSGRLYPYITILADINKYDGGKYHYLKIKKELRNTNTLIKFDEINDMLMQKREEKREENEELDCDDLQKELEERFNQLFGPLEDESEEG